MLTIQQTLLPLILSLLFSPTTAAIQPRDAESSYNSAQRTITGGAIALIVIFTLFGAAIVVSAIVFCCIIARNKKRRTRQAAEIKAANERAAARRGAYAAAPQHDVEEGRMGGFAPYRYGGQMAELPSQGLNEVDGGPAVQRPVEADSRPRGPGELP